ncbi:MAG: helix-turn-helix domain-containing protein [Desulfosarcina sp.]|nr:helix-turn-helix domain-containing protein [Desulfobacterales bacterium]
MPPSFNSPVSRPENLVQAIERATVTMNILGQFPQGLSVGEIAARSGLPRGTAHRLLSSLVYFDFV